MKTGKKIAVLLLVFVAAAVVYFVWPLGKKDERGTGATYTAMGEATLPVVYPQMLEREMAPLFGQMEEKAATAERGSLLLLPEDRKLVLRVAEAKQVVSLRYEIRSMDMDHLVERTELSGWQEVNGEIMAELPIQNLLESGTEYLLGLNAELSDGRSVWYYARVLEAENEEHVKEMLALAEEFSLKTLDYTAAQELTMYMESSNSADNSSFGNVTLKNSFTQITWGSLNVQRTGDVYLELKELSGELANVELRYYVARTEQELTETYAVTENFTMKWATQRVYMMDYEREMNQLFTGERALFSGKRILLGIGSGNDICAKKSAGSQITAFVTGRELWLYDSGESESVRVFSFGGSETADVRNNHDRHGVEILEVGETGNLDFLVYGYMNRGAHEGWTGVAYYHYDYEKNSLEEQFFLPADEGFAELKDDVELLAHKGSNGIFYLLMNHAVYGIDLNSREYLVVASGLTEGKFAVSADGSRMAWQENTGMYDSRLLHVMDLDTGDKTQFGDGKTGAYRILGFVGNDCIYGSGDYGDYIMSNGRIMGLYLKTIDIVDRRMENAMHYEKSGSYIRDVQVDESRIHIKSVKEKNGGFFGTFSEDTLVCNGETLPGKMDDIGWYASDVKGRVYFVQLSADITSTQKIRTFAPKLLTGEETVIQLDAPAGQELMEFYAYGRGKYLGKFVRFSEAAEAAYDNMGFVTAGKNREIWVRANKSNAYYIRDLEGAARRLERYRESFTETAWSEEDCLMLDASGCTLNQVLYFVGRGMPVLLYTGEGSFLYLTGYDQSHVRVYYPASGMTETLSLDSAETYFSGLGNDYVCCVMV